YFAERDNPWLFTLAVVLALGTREDATIPVVGLGIWLALAKRRWLWGGVTAMAAVALLVVDTRWLIRHFRGAPYPHLGRYAHLGRTVPEIMAALLLHPFRTLGALWGLPRLSYLGDLLGPLVFLPLLSRIALLAHRERPRRPALLAAGRASPGLGGHGPGAAGRFDLGAGPVCRAPLAPSPRLRLSREPREGAVCPRQRGVISLATPPRRAHAAGGQGRGDHRGRRLGIRGRLACGCGSSFHA